MAHADGELRRAARGREDKRKQAEGLNAPMHRA
jgi:hypothetical protein